MNSLNNTPKQHIKQILILGEIFLDSLIGKKSKAFVGSEIPSELDSEDLLSDKNWNDVFSKENIEHTFKKYIFPKGGQGVDRLSVNLFKRDLTDHTDLIIRKCRSGTYKFSPYLEMLQSKGRDKNPRIISIPTVRDRVVLKLLTEYLHRSFEEYIARDLPNTVVKKIKREIKDKNSAYYIKLDLKNFYGSILHEKLMANIVSENGNKPFLKLLRKAIKNPTLPANYSAKQRKDVKNNEVGVPQGLSISNILAEIYVKRLDDTIRPISMAYFRFVDDVFILCDKNSIKTLWEKINEISESLGIEINTEKSISVNSARSISAGFDFLGYKFLSNSISVRESSYKRFLDSVIGKIIKFKYDLEKAPATDKEQKKLAFIEEINEKITGAIDGNRRYGWIFFFSEINDLQMLSGIDRIISNMFLRIKDFSESDRKKIKKITRAHYEVNYSPQKGYIHNYNHYSDVKKKMDYLIRIGVLESNPNARYENAKIESLFEEVKTKNLLKLEQDISTFS